jgi:hypothetical protein
VVSLQSRGQVLRSPLSYSWHSEFKIDDKNFPPPELINPKIENNLHSSMRRPRLRYIGKYPTIGAQCMYTYLGRICQDIQAELEKGTENDVKKMVSGETLFCSVNIRVFSTSQG